MLFRIGDSGGGLAELLRAVKVDPTSAEGHTFLANVYQELGQTQNSSRERAKAAE